MKQTPDYSTTPNLTGGKDILRSFSFDRLNAFFNKYTYTYVNFGKDLIEYRGL